MGNALGCTASGPKHDDEDSFDEVEDHFPNPNTSVAAKNSRFPDLARSRSPTSNSTDWSGTQKLRSNEKDIPLRHSELWDIQRRFYIKNGSNCWTNLKIPCFQSSNAFIAHSTAKVVAAFLHDWFIDGPGANDLSQPMYIFEVGSGHGKFSYLILSILLDMEQFLPCLKDGKHAFVYVISDISAHALLFIENHPVLAPFFEAGIAETAIFDAENPNSTGEILLRLSKKIVNLENTNTPVVAICNYVIDSLITDAFRVVDGCMHELLVSINTTYGTSDEDPEVRRASSITSSKTGGGDSPCSERMLQSITPPRSSSSLCEPTIDTPSPQKLINSMNDLQVEWSLSTMGINAEEVGKIYDVPNGGGMSDNSEFASILKEYLTDPEAVSAFQEKGGTVLLPIGGLCFLRWLAKMGGGKNLVLVGDKGYGSVSEMKGVNNPHLASHGSFSMMTNMDALARYSRANGGSVLMSPYQDGFKCLAMFRGIDENAVQETMLAWEEAFTPVGPDNFTVIQKIVKEQVSKPSVKLISALLRMGHMDADLFYKFNPSLLSRASTDQMNSVTIEDLKFFVRKIVKQVYPLHPAKDVLFKIARLLMALKVFGLDEFLLPIFQITPPNEYTEAVEMLKYSKQIIGSHHVTHHNIGICRYHLGQYELALESFNASLDLRPDFEEATQWKVYCSAKMGM